MFSIEEKGPASDLVHVGWREGKDSREKKKNPQKRGKTREGSLKAVASKA